MTMKRSYHFITSGWILDRLEEQGLKISKPTLHGLMRKENLFQMKKNAGGWYVCSPRDAALIIKLVKENYGIN